METKKSQKADLEHLRPQGFLLGLVVALALLFVGLEYTVEPDDPLDDPELLARLDSEMELPPMLKDDNLLQLAPKAEPKPQTQIVVVEEQETEAPPDDDELIETEAGDDMEAMEEDEQMEPPPPPDDDVVDMIQVEELPQFPGGPVEMMKWLTRNLKYPRAAEEQKVQGRVVAEFIVNRDGSVTDVNLIATLHPQCDNEVLRVLRMMPRWTPGTEKGEPCRTKVCIPVVFKM
mgnify:CR=1 FL=1